MTTVRGDIKSELGQKLQNYRTDRPDEWTMDEFTRAAEEMQDHIVELEGLVKEAANLIFEECGAVKARPFIKALKDKS